MSKNLFNLTSPQESIWYTEEYLSGTNIGNICGTLIFKDSVDFKKLEKAINILIKQHDNFRIKFILNNNIPKQYIEDYSYIRLKPFEIFTNKDLLDLEKRTVSNKFNLIENFLYKFIIFKFSDNTGGFILNIHHLISDGWSFNILLNEIIKIYDSLLKNEEIEIPSYSYINYIKKENNYLNSTQFKNDKEFWNSTINEIPEIAILPNLKNSADNLFSYESKRLDFEIPSNLLDSIKELCNKYNISLFNFFMSIYSIYINRVTNLNEFIIGTPILNRSNFEERNTCGMFTSTVPFKVLVDNNIKFSDFILNISKSSLQYLRHQKYPYHSLLTDIKEKNNKFSKLYTILLSYQNSFYPKNIDSKKYKLHWTSNNCISDSLDIHIYDISSEKINISYDYKADFYDDVDIVSIHNRIINIIYQIIHNSQIHLNDIKLLTSDEEKEILIDFNNNDLKYSNRNIVELFKDNVYKFPNNIALIYKNKTLTYSQLDILSNQMAHYLNSIGLEKNSIISVCLPKDIWFVISLIAIQKIGGIYLPISINYPQDRINFMIDDSRSDAIITNLNINNVKCKKISINSINFNEFSTDYSIPVISLEDLSYIIYTSGSTGKPKGIKITHGNLLNFVHSFNNCFSKKFDSSDYCLSITDISFDVSICELIVPLVFGSKLVLYEENTLTDLNLLCETIYKNKITFLYLPPNILTDVYELLRNVHTDINKFLVGIAPIKSEVLNNYLNLNSNMEIINAYGASEATICSTFYKFKKSTDSNSIVPIGKPINNNRIYILDNYKNIQPIGLKGEIYISGKNVSNGYLNNDNLSKANFIEDPFFPGNKCYKTGDIAYWNPDGNISFVGRNDNQIKFRGYRIELEEITNIIKQINAISNAVTILKEINNIEYIVSYYEGDLDDINKIKSYLKTKLPVYMVPSYIIRLNKIPININGKIDEHNLPDINTSLSTKLDPVNNTEEILLDMWKNILNINDIGTNEDFFEIGGDSLSAIRLLSNIKNTFNIDISISDIFNNSTIRNLSIFINLHDKSNTLKIYRSPKKDYYNVSSAQRRMYYTTYMINPNNIVYNVTGSALFDLILDVEKVKNIFNYLIKRHSSFRTCFRIVNDTLVQIVKDSVSININTRKIVSGDIHEIVNNFSKPFDLSNAPILRIELVYIENKTLLLIDSHHIIIDGKSLNILISEFIDLYNNKLLGNLELEYKDYSEWEYSYINSNNIKANEEYWINKFKNEEIVSLNLPYDHNKTNKITYKGNTITQKIDENLFNDLLQLAKKLEVSPFMLFITILYILLYKYTQDKSIIIGTPVESRYCKEIENIIGMFVNTMPIKINLESNKSFRELLENVKNTIITDLEHQPYPYDLLIKKLNISKSNSSNPLFDVAFTYKNNKDLYLNNKKIKITEAKPNVSKFDLSVEIDAQNNEINFNYSTDLFKISTIKDMLLNYINILNVINENTDILLRNINMLPEDYKYTILNSFNNNKKEYPLDTNIISLFENQVENNKNNIALKYLKQEITYDNLNKKVNQFANYLLSLGIKENSHIAVYMDKNISLIISLLAVNKINCSFIPICSDFPPEKINNILADSNTDYIIVNNNTYGIKCDNIINFQDIDLNKFNYENLNINILPNDILYIIYTSGTTGTPKGITISNRNLINFLYSFNDQFDNKFNSKDICLSLTSISFDVFICELFTPLIFGSTLVIYPNNKLNDITLLYEIIKKENITFLHIPASVLDDVYNYISSKNEHIEINKLLVGVESIKNASLNNYYNINPDIEIVNGYGPSETTICCTFFKHKKTRNKNLIVPIGKPVNNNDIYIINDDYNLQPIGVKRTNMYFWRKCFTRIS